MGRSIDTDKAETKRHRSARHRVRNVLVFVLVQAVLVFVLLEIGGRLFDPMGISYYPRTARYLDTLVHEETIGYRNRPGLSGEYYGTTVTINSHGLRDREVSFEKDPDEFRILVMGDSVPFGIGVEYEESIPYRLEQIANQEHEGERRYRTINMGVPSYNTEQELIQFKTLGRLFQPDLVSVSFVGNDIQSKMWVFDKRASWIANLSQRSYAASLLFVSARLLINKIRQGGGGGGADTSVRTHPVTADHPGWQAIDRAFTELNQLCRSMSVPLVVFNHTRTGHWSIDLLAALGRREGFAVVPLRPWEDPRWAQEPWRKYQNSPVDSHANPEGCEIYARVIWEELKGRGLLD